MKVLGKLLGHFTVKNDNNKDLFIVFFYEKGISFEEDFLRGIIENESIYRRFIQINDFWKNRSETEELNSCREQSMTMIMDLLQENQEYLSEFFVVEKKDNSQFDNNKIFLEHLREEDLLKEITRKEFESKVKDENIGEFYVENLNVAKELAKFYTYKSKKTNLDFYLMVIDDKIKIGFADKENLPDKND
jgi:hypothetical protein